jgi:hypothetical protein
MYSIQCMCTYFCYGQTNPHTIVDSPLDLSFTLSFYLSSTRATAFLHREILTWEFFFLLLFCFLSFFFFFPLWLFPFSFFGGFYSFFFSLVSNSSAAGFLLARLSPLFSRESTDAGSALITSGCGFEGLSSAPTFAAIGKRLCLESVPISLNSAQASRRATV